MKIPDIDDHLLCFNYDLSEKPAIEVISVQKDMDGQLIAHGNKVIFVLNGNIDFIHEGKNSSYSQGQGGQMLFLPEVGIYSYKAKTAVQFILFRLNSMTRLCNDFSIERLYKLRNKELSATIDSQDRNLGKLYINRRLYHFLKGIKICIADGLRCRYWFDLKIKEFFTLIRVYYTKEEIGRFFFQILNADTEFTDFVHQNWQQFRNVNEMAAHIHMTPKLFSIKFNAIFGMKPSRWLTDQKAYLVYGELSTTKKPFKQIAIEYGFSTDASFTRFCKKELGNTPTNIRNK